MKWMSLMTNVKKSRLRSVFIDESFADLFYMPCRIKTNIHKKQGKFVIIGPLPDFFVVPKDRPNLGKASNPKYSIED